MTWGKNWTLGRALLVGGTLNMDVVAALLACMQPQIIHGFNGCSRAGETGDRRNIIPIILSGRGKLSARFGVANQKELAPIATLRHVVRRAGDDDPSESSHGATP